MHICALTVTCTVHLIGTRCYSVDDILIIAHESSKINRLKSELSKSFATKDLGSTKQILGMKISCDRENKKLWLSQESYIDKVLKRFNMSKAKVVCSPLVGHLKLSYKKCPTSEKDMNEMKKFLMHLLLVV